MIREDAERLRVGDEVILTHEYDIALRDLVGCVGCVVELEEFTSGSIWIRVDMGQRFGVVGHQPIWFPAWELCMFVDEHRGTKTFCAGCGRDWSAES